MQDIKKKILIVEDEILTSKVISKHLELNNYETLVANTGEDSINFVKKDPNISLVIMDIDLGNGIDGIETSKEILKIRELPIVFHTNHSEKETVEKVRNIARYGYVLKSPADFIFLSAVDMAFKLFEDHQKSKENELRWKFALEGARDGVWDWNIKTGQVFFSKQWKAMLGYQEDEIKDSLDEWKNRIHPDDLDICYKEIKKHLNKESDYYQSEHRLKTKQGDYIWVLDRGKVFEYSEDGNPIRMIGTHTNITEEKNLEKSLFINENNFRTFFNSINEYIFVLDNEGLILKINDFALNNLGYNENDLIGKNIINLHKFCSECNIFDSNFSFFDAIESKNPLFILKYDNNQIEVESKIIKGHWNNKNALFLVEKDISELKHSEEKFEKIFHNSNSLMAISVIETGEIIDINNRFLDVLGYERSEVIGSSTISLGIWLDNKQRENIIDLLNKNQKIYNYEISVKTKNGKEKIGLFSAEIIKVNNKKVVFTEMQDITEVKIAQDRIKESEELYKLLAENTNDVIWKTDLNLNFIYVSPSVFQLRGYTPEEVKKQSIEEVICPTSLPIIKEALSYAMSNLERMKDFDSERRYFEIEQPCKDGSTIWTEVTAKIVFRDGLPIGLVGVSRDISERKKSEDSLKYSEEHLKNAQRIANIASWTWNIDNDYIYWSEEVFRIFEVNAEDLKNTYSEYINYIHPDDRNYVDSIIKKTIDYKTSYEVEYRIILNNGKQKYINEIGECIFENNKIISLTGTIQDITEKKEILLKLQDSEKMLKDAQRIANVGNWIWNLKTNNIFWTEQVYRIFELNKETFNPSYENTLKMVHPDDVDKVKRTVEKALKDKKPYFVVHRIISPNGSLKTVQENAELRFDENNNLIEIVGTLKDITDYKRIENYLRENNALLSSFINSIPDLIFFKDLDGTYIGCNNAMSELIGKPVEHIVGKNDYMFFDKEFADFVIEQDKKVLEDNKIHSNEEWLTYPDGKKYLFEVLKAPLRFEDGIVFGTLGVARNITEKKEQENEIKKLLDEKEILLKEVHHRIKNNLATIASLLSIQSAEIKDKNVVQALKETRSRIKTMVDIYDRIYRSSDYKSINLKDYLVDIINKISSSYIISKNIKIEIDVEDLIVDIKISFPIGIIVTELITNSLKYGFDQISKENISGLISIKLFKEDDKYIVMDIFDNGKGIDPEILKSKKYGFGLNLIDILLNNKGTIEISNDNGTRSIVKIEI